MNGYQRDWYGFNKGAVIGSFNGVNWFAVGGGRRVEATSSKLFLAINSPFSDMASSNDMRVSIITETGDNIAADYDYDPNLNDKDARNDAGATCRKYHQCENDADCVTQLGWEYMCADVLSMRTNLPTFDGKANEKSGEDNMKLSAGASELLTVKDFLPAGLESVVYRGAGAICQKDFLESSSLNPGADEDISPSARRTKDRLKPVTCAPNFHCADLVQKLLTIELLVMQIINQISFLGKTQMSSDVLFTI